MKKMNQKQFNKLRTEFLPEALEIVERPAAPLGNIIIWWCLFYFLPLFYGHVSEKWMKLPLQEDRL